MKIKWTSIYIEPYDLSDVENTDGIAEFEGWDGGMSEYSVSTVFPSQWQMQFFIIFTFLCWTSGIIKSHSKYLYWMASLRKQQTHMDKGNQDSSLYQAWEGTTYTNRVQLGSTWIINLVFSQENARVLFMWHKMTVFIAYVLNSSSWSLWVGSCRGCCLGLHSSARGTSVLNLKWLNFSSYSCHVIPAARAT